MVEKVGSGILRMEELMLGNNLPSPIYQKEGMFTVIFKRPVAAVAKETVEKTVEENLTETSEKILGFIEKNNSITISELAKMIGVTNRTIERQLYKLQKANKIERIGSRKSGHWRISPKPF